MSRQGFPRRVYGHGTEPDPRFSVANERTFLAWIRTGLALYAAAFALEALALPASLGWRMVAAGLFLALGTLAVIQAWIGWIRTESALRDEQPLRASGVGAILAGGIVLAVGGQDVVDARLCR